MLGKQKVIKKQSFSLVCACGWQLSIANSYSSQSYLMDMSVDGGQIINLKMTISSSLRLVNQICSKYSKVTRQHYSNSLPAVQHTSDTLSFFTIYLYRCTVQARVQSLNKFQIILCLLFNYQVATYYHMIQCLQLSLFSEVCWPVASVQLVFINLFRPQHNHVYVSVSVCPHLKLLITADVMLHDMGPNFYSL